MRVTSEYFENERYSCRSCNKILQEKQVNTETWRCDACGKKLLIDIGKRNKLVRLLPSEMTEYDTVYDQYTEKLHELKGINSKGEKYIFGVKGYRGISVSEDEFVNCMWNDQ
ncbi:hypothetical protein [Psychrobacillus lasiicapitis]|uniref:Uncharacterized protein n=1 Tax=Psychrobacillus lasiicapitis TaxID=1636719 RepID=A0A544TAI2_9BACI|nr:hypothetical protein [Psychrobacillus lasiicapitis]TQR14481.1 hypothetical protein FG382_08475 [Psychrobacillus lasiicapitis]GGA30954.1 hypothetical protein GCM10011384_20580 [Psychrobacillus lasiicapitis]